MIKRIAILGPESTGKSVLSKQLSEKYNTIFVKEYSREYFANKEYTYNIFDLERIALKQLENENNLSVKANNILFCDTEFITLKVWSDIVFNKTPNSIIKLIKSHKYNYFLLCNIDIKWEPDSLRSNEHNRQEIFNMFITELNNYGFNFDIVSGYGKDRLENAINFVDQFLNNDR